MASRTVLLAFSNLLIPVAILVFATGFFPYKPFMPGLAVYEEIGTGNAFKEGRQKTPEPPFDKVVFMVVDALRSDFVFGEESGMTFVQRHVLQYRRGVHPYANYCPVSYAMVPQYPSQLMPAPPPSRCPASRPSPQARFPPS
jgi:hypothetical protein